MLNQGLYPALEALGLEQVGMHAFRRGCNRRWELAGVNRAVIRQQMGLASAAMTALYTGEIPLEQIRTEFSMKFGNKIDVLEPWKTARLRMNLERAMGIEPTSEAWEDCCFKLQIEYRGD